MVVEPGQNLAVGVPSYAPAVSDETNAFLASSAASTVLAVPVDGGDLVSFTQTADEAATQDL